MNLSRDDKTGWISFLSVILAVGLGYAAPIPRVSGYVVTAVFLGLLILAFVLGVMGRRTLQGKAGLAFSFCFLFFVATEMYVSWRHGHNTTTHTGERQMPNQAIDGD